MIGFLGARRWRGFEAARRDDGAAGVSATLACAAGLQPTLAIAKAAACLVRWARDLSPPCYDDFVSHTRNDGDAADVSRLASRRAPTASQ